MAKKKKKVGWVNVPVKKAPNAGVKSVGLKLVFSRKKIDFTVHWGYPKTLVSKTYDRRAETVNVEVAAINKDESGVYDVTLKNSGFLPKAQKEKTVTYDAKYRYKAKKTIKTKVDYGNGLVQYGLIKKGDILTDGKTRKVTYTPYKGVEYSGDTYLEQQKVKISVGKSKKGVHGSKEVPLDKDGNLIHKKGLISYFEKIMQVADAEKPSLTHIYAAVTTMNSEGYGKTVYSVSEIKAAATPIEENPVYVADTRTVTLKLVGSPTANLKPFFHTLYSYYIIKYSGDGTEKILNSTQSVSDTQSATVSKTYTLKTFDEVTEDSVVVVMLESSASGFGGRSATTRPDSPFKGISSLEKKKFFNRYGNYSSHTYFIYALPGTYKIGKVSNSKGRVQIKAESIAKYKKLRKTDTIELQRLKDFFAGQRYMNSEESVWESLADLDDGWSTVAKYTRERISEGEPVEFIRNIEADRAGQSSDGNKNPYSRTFYRVVCSNNTMEDFEYTSASKTLPGYKTLPSAKEEKVEFLELASGGTGESVKVVLAYDVGEDDYGRYLSDGVELSWSDDVNAWRSNQGPSTFDAPDFLENGDNWFRDPDFVCASPDPDRKHYLMGTGDYDPVTGTPEKKGKGRNPPFKFTSSVYLKGLTSGLEYHFKARRYLEAIDDFPRSYGSYTDFTGQLAFSDASDPNATIKADQKPENLKIKEIPNTPIGKDIGVEWTFEGDGKQTQWEIVAYRPEDVHNEVDAEGESYDKADDDATKYKIVEGTGSAGFVSIPYYNETKNGTVINGIENVGEEVLVNNEIYIAVGVYISGFVTYSNPVKVTYMESPDSRIGIDGVIVKQPVELTIGTNDPDCSAIIRVVCTKSIAYLTPEGASYQPKGDIVYSNKYKPDELKWTLFESPRTNDVSKAWSEVDNKLITTDSITHYANVMLPRGLELHDKGEYSISLELVNDETKMDSKVIDASGALRPIQTKFTVDYSRDPIAPAKEKCIVTSDVESLSATIHLPTHANNARYSDNGIGTSTGDLCDIYRVTPDGATLVAEGVSFGKTVVDNFAPYCTDKPSFSDPNEKAIHTRYRIATRTPDGQEDWIDVLYNLTHTAIRFDWGNKEYADSTYTYLEIPYNLDYSDSFKKYFDGRHHIENKKVTGYWDDFLDRTSSFKTDIIKYDDYRDKEALRALASYSGPVYVRRPDGCAYLANVEVSSIGETHNSQTTSVSFTVTEINLESEYMIKLDDPITKEDEDYLKSLNVVPDTYQSVPHFVPISRDKD